MFKPRTPIKPKTPTSSKTPLRGLYENGQWKCSCSPNRFIAAKRQVQKDGPNHGRYFYTCPKGNCKFFLWESEAHHREQQTPVNDVDSNASSTSTSSIHYPKLPHTPSTSRRSTGLATPHASPSKRRAAVAFDMDVVFSSDEESDPDKTADEEKDPDSLSDEFVVIDNRHAQSPRKQLRASKAQTSPSKRHRELSGPVKDDPFTPSKALAIGLHNVNINKSPSARRRLFQPQQPLGQTQFQAPQTQMLAGSDLEAEVLAVMNRIYGASALPAELVEVIQRHHRQKEGLLHGRDVVRKLYSEAKKENDDLKQKLALAERQRDEARFVADMLEEEKREVHDLNVSLGNKHQEGGRRNNKVLRAYFDGAENATIYGSSLGSQETVEDTQDSI